MTDRTHYIGTATSRVDGLAKVTGAAKYAGEFNVDGLAYGSVVSSSIAKGRIRRIDASEALHVDGVIDVLTHENRPPMAKSSHAYKDDVAPDGAPFRPLYDGRIAFSRQPVALVLAEEWEIARFAGSLVRVEYEAEKHATDLLRQREEAHALPPATKPRGQSRQGAGRRRGAARRRVLHPDRASQSHGVVRLDRDLGGRRQAHGARQDPGRAERATLSVRRVRHEARRRARRLAVRRRRVRLGPAAAIPGGAGRAGGAGAEALGAAGADARADVRAVLPAGHHRAPRAGRQGGRDARGDHA